MKFRSDNQILYGQDFCVHTGIPCGVEFKVFRFGNVGYKLIGDGYGDRSHPNSYGNGSLFVYHCRLNSKQKRRFEKHIIGEATNEA